MVDGVMFGAHRIPRSARAAYHYACGRENGANSTAFPAAHLRRAFLPTTAPTYLLPHPSAPLHLPLTYLTRY